MDGLQEEIINPPEYFKRASKWMVYSCLIDIIKWGFEYQTSGEYFIVLNKMPNSFRRDSVKQEKNTYFL